jgi:predicted RNA-binding protein with PUA-like domain
MRYWLMKSEPDEVSIDDLAAMPKQTVAWYGVRNYQARNFMRDRMQVGDPVLFYASNAEPSGVTGLAKIARAGYPDAYAFKPDHKYYDPESDKGEPVWYMVDLEFVEAFKDVVSLETLKNTKGLEQMVVTRKGSRLSVQPVSKDEYDIVVRLGRSAKSVRHHTATARPSGSTLVKKKSSR